MTLEQYYSLTLEEIQFLHVIINELNPSVMPYKLDHSVFVSIKHNYLMDRLAASEKLVAIEYRDFYKKLVDKLK